MGKGSTVGSGSEGVGGDGEEGWTGTTGAVGIPPDCLLPPCTVSCLAVILPVSTGSGLGVIRTRLIRAVLMDKDTMGRNSRDHAFQLS